jgi:glycerophosphoryl diester phosphodiesterase
MTLPALAGLQAARAGFPGRASTALQAGWCDAIMAHWRLVTPRLVRHVQAAGGELYVWTVDEPERIRELARLGVTGVISNDPRLFAELGLG